MNNVIQEANQMLHTMSIPSGKYFMTSLAFASINPHDAQQVLQNDTFSNQYTPTQQVMFNSLQDIKYKVNPMDIKEIQNYLQQPDVLNQVRNRTLLSNLSKTNLPNAFRKILIHIPKLTSAQILHKFYINNIVRQHNKSKLSPAQHLKYQNILNQGVALGTHLSPIGLNYLRQSINIYQQHPALLYAIKTRNINSLSDSDLDAYQDIQDIEQGTMNINNQTYKIQEPVNNVDRIKVNQYVYNLPNQVLKSDDLTKLLRNVSGKNEDYKESLQNKQFLQQWINKSPEEKQCYKYLINRSNKSYKDVQALLKGQINNTNTKNMQQHLLVLMQGKNNQGQQQYNTLTPVQNKELKSFFINPNNAKVLQNGNFNKLIYNYEYGNTSINDIVQQSLINKPQNSYQQKRDLNQLSYQYKTFDVQTQKYMRTIIRNYAYNPQSFEREYIANMSGNPHMLKALSHSEKMNWKHIQNVAQGKISNQGQLIKTGNTAQHKLDVDYLISEPKYRNIFRNGSLNLLLNKDKDVQQLSATNYRAINEMANTVKSPYSSYATLHTKEKLDKMFTKVQKQPSSLSKEKSESQQYASPQKHFK